MEKAAYLQFLILQIEGQLSP